MYPLNMECGIIDGLITLASFRMLSLKLPCLSVQIEKKALRFSSLPCLCSLNFTVCNITDFLIIYSKRIKWRGKLGFLVEATYVYIASVPGCPPYTE